MHSKLSGNIRLPLKGQISNEAKQRPEFDNAAPRALFQKASTCPQSDFWLLLKSMQVHLTASEFLLRPYSIRAEVKRRHYSNSARHPHVRLSHKSAGANVAARPSDSNWPTVAAPAVRTKRLPDTLHHVIKPAAFQMYWIPGRIITYLRRRTSIRLSMAEGNGAGLRPLMFPNTAAVRT